MAGLTDKDIRHIAKLARLKLEENEIPKFAKELSAILAYVNLLNELDTENVPATAQVTGIENVLREDRVQKSEASKKDLLECSPLPIVNDQIETLSTHERH